MEEDNKGHDRRWTKNGRDQAEMAGMRKDKWRNDPHINCYRYL